MHDIFSPLLLPPISLGGFVHKQRAIARQSPSDKGPAFTLNARNGTLIRQEGEKLLQQREYFQFGK